MIFREFPLVTEGEILKALHRIECDLSEKA